MVSSPKLTPKQALFVAEYLKDLNCTQAAIRAGYSKKTAKVQGSRLLTNVDVARAVDAKKEARAKKVGLSADEVLEGIAKIARVDLRLAFDDKGRLKPIHELPEEVASAISGVEVDQMFDGTGPNRYHAGDTMKVKFWDKLKALELAGKHLKLFTDKVEHSGNVSIGVVSPYADAVKP